MHLQIQSVTSLPPSLLSLLPKFLARWKLEFDWRLNTWDQIPTNEVSNPGETGVHVCESVSACIKG